MSPAMVRRLGLAALLSAAGAIGPAAAHGPVEKLPAGAAVDAATSLETSQRAIGRMVGGYRFSDAKGAKLDLSELRGKPLVIR